MEHVLSNHGQEVPCYFLIGRDERVFKTVSAPDLAPLNTEGAVLPIFSVKKEKQQPEYFTFNEVVNKMGPNIVDMNFIKHTLFIFHHWV